MFFIDPPSPATRALANSKSFVFLSVCPSLSLSLSLCIMQTLFRHCYIIKQEVSPLKFAQQQSIVQVKLTGDLACSPSSQRYCSFVAAFSWQGSMSQDLMLHRSTVAAQGVCLPFWEMLQLVTKELVSGKRGSVKQRSGRQSKRKEQRQWEWKETDLTVRIVAKERQEKTGQHVPNISLVNQSSS